MTINDVLPLKAARRDVIANLKCFWSLGHQRPNFECYIYIHYAAPPYSARISAIYFFTVGHVWLGSVSACNAWEVQCRIYERWVSEPPHHDTQQHPVTAIVNSSTTGSSFQTNVFRQTFLQHAAPSVWNSLTTSVLNCDSLTLFKAILKTHLFSSVSGKLARAARQRL